MYLSFIITSLNFECVLCLCVCAWDVCVCVCVCWLGHLDVWGELAGHNRFLTHHPSSQGWAFRCPVITLARMRSEGTVVVCSCLSVCLSVTLHLTSRMFVRLTNDTTYLTGNEGQKFRTVFSENAPLQS